jgi:hypothetical protein
MDQHLLEVLEHRLDLVVPLRPKVLGHLEFPVILKVLEFLVDL